MLREEPPWAKSVHILVSRSTPHVGSGAPMSACVSPPEFLARKSRNELLDLHCCFVRILFWEKVPAFHRLSASVRSPSPPDAQRTAVFCVKSIKGTTLGPQVQHGAFDFLESTPPEIDLNLSPSAVDDEINARHVAAVA
jgi:hypothetical protein